MKCTAQNTQINPHPIIVIKDKYILFNIFEIVVQLLKIVIGIIQQVKIRKGIERKSTAHIRFILFNDSFLLENIQYRIWSYL
jgi:hypothetical protein